MININERALLPAGFHDLLPPEATFQHEVIDTLVRSFREYGYGLVNPPLAEFEASLFAGHGDALTGQSFRLLDPQSHQMMGIRPDITMQVARIAATRLRNEPRPLRLSYAGPSLRVKGTDLYGERQLIQAGIELIGAEVTDIADSEVITVAIDSLVALGLTELSIDFNLPSFCHILLDQMALVPEIRTELHHALNRKDATKIAALAGEMASLLQKLLTPHAKAEATLDLLFSLDVPEEAKNLCNQLRQVVSRIKELHPQVNLTIDVLEYHGFEYYSGIGFAIFSTANSAEVARGGRYFVDKHVDDTSAVGVTIDVNTVMRIVPLSVSEKRILIPLEITREQSIALRKDGFITVQMLTNENILLEAKRQKCNYVWEKGRIENI